MADDAMLKKVRGLLTVADDERCSEGERDNARTLAAKLQAKHSITEADLAEHDEPGGLFEGLFGGLRFGQTNGLSAEVDRIWAEVDTLVDRTVRDEQGRARAEAVNAIYGRLRSKLGDATREPDDGTLKARRDEVLTDYFDAFMVSQRKNDSQWRQDGGGESEEERKHWERYRQEQAYEGVAWRIRADGASLNKSTVEHIVERVKLSRGGKARSARETAVRKQPCTYCGSAEAIEAMQSIPVKDKRTKEYRTATYRGVDHITAYWDGDRVFPAHPSCYRDATKASA